MRCTVEQYAQWSSAYGECTGATYQPFLTVRTFSSRGTSCRINGRVTGRLHHLFSRLEARAFCLQDWRDDVVDIREQFPLDPDITRQIAKEFGIRHPAQRSRSEPWVMTTDLVVTERGQFDDRLLALSIKPRDEQNRPRVREKLRIEQVYWERKEASFRVCGEEDLDPIQVANIEWLQRSDPAAVQACTERVGREHLIALAEALTSYSAAPLGRICTRMDERFGAEPGDSLVIVRAKLASKCWSADLRSVLHPMKPLVGFLAARRGTV